MSGSEARLTSGRVEYRSKDNERPKIGGYAAKFMRQSRNLGGFVEQIDKAAFNKSRGDGWPNVRARYNHEILLGTTAASTLELDLDDVGLRYDVFPPASRADVVELVQRGDVQHSSFAFRTIEDDWGLNDLDIPLRTLMSVQLVDVAPVDDPAYWDTSVGARAIQPAFESLAAKFEASADEVRSLGQQNELRRFFKRTDEQAPKQLYGPQLRALLLRRASE